MLTMNMDNIDTIDSIANNKQRAYKDWDYTFNYPNTPENVSIHSTQEFRWVCHKCGNAWLFSPNDLKFTCICPYCAWNKPKVGVDDLAHLYPAIAKEWDYIKNAPLKPSEIKSTVGRKVYWICPKGHSYKMSIQDRTLRHRGCSICTSRQIISGVNDFKTLHPEIMPEWNYEKNDLIGVYPDKISENAHVYAYWKCSKGHEWCTQVYNRITGGTSCPKCDTSGTSYPEQYIYLAFKQIFPKTVNRYKTTTGVEYDIAIPEIRLLIEYSGINWHRGKEGYAEKKKKIAEKYGFKFIEIVADERFRGTTTHSDSRIIFNPSRHLEVKLQGIIDLICKLNNLDAEVNYSGIDIEARQNSSGSIVLEKSLAYKFPDIANELDVKRSGINDEALPAYSNKRVYWICSKCGHSWVQTVGNRTSNKSGCPKCRGMV